MAERGAAALALELGWTFPEAPTAMVEACRRHGLPLVVLREVVPFVEITEQVQSAIMEDAQAGRHRERDVRQVLTDALLDGAGPGELTAVLAELVHAPVTVTTADGALVASAGMPPDSSGRRGRPVARQDVVLLERHWGQVAVLPPARAGDPTVAAVCSYGAEALGLALLRSASGGDLDHRRAQLLTDLTERRWRVPGELVARARVLGLPFTAEGRYVGLLVTGLRRADLEAVVRAVTGALPPGTALVADVGDDVVAVVRTSGALTAARTVLAAVDRVPTDGLALARVVAGPVVGRLEEADRSLSAARRALELTPDGDRLVSAGQLTAQLLLSGVGEDPMAHQLVREEIGRLVEHDATHGTELVITLRVYLASSSSKVRTSEALRVRRQTVHGRLQRIEELIGDVHSSSRHTSLVVALAMQQVLR
jgi:purine catabolism regulator